MSYTRYKQEMPPTGGYDPLDLLRKPKSFIKGRNIFFVFFAFPTGLTIFHMHHGRQKLYAEKTEMQDARIAVEPFMHAERVRTMLKHLHKNREREAQLMKGNPYWSVGRLYNEPVFHNPRGRFITPDWEEFYMHNDPKDQSDRMFHHVKH